MCRRDPMVNLNYCVFLYNTGDRKAAAKQFSIFEQKFQALRSSNPNEIDQEVHIKAYVSFYPQSIYKLNQENPSA